MGTNIELVVFMAAAHMWLSMMAMIIKTRKQKQHAHTLVGHISYGPMNRDRMRIEYLNDKIWRNDATCVNKLRLKKALFFCFCELF
jgi:cAMP phosphodiesterase